MLQVEEVGFRDQPPFLENTGVVGPMQSPVLDAMTTLEERERIEADYEWFRYSKFALPFLVFNLLVAVVLYCLSAWHGGLSTKHIRSGVPRLIEAPTKIDDAEGGIPKPNRNVRISCFVIGLTGLIGILIVMHLKPAPQMRKLAYFLFSALLIISGILGAIAGGIDASQVGNATWCRSRERGTVPLPNNCYSMTKMAVALTVVDLAVASFGVLTAIVLCLAAAKSFSASEDEEVEQRGVSRTTRECLLLLLFGLFVNLTLMFVFTIILHEGRDIRFADEAFFVREFNNDKPGWPVKNTRLRLSATTIVILMTLFNLIPFRSRVFAYVCAFVYMCASALLLVNFCLDVKAVDTARRMTCPFGWTCKYATFITTCVLDISLAMFLVLYVIFEFVARLLNECRHCTRHYGFHEIQKHETQQCSHRPVRCEVCSKQMPAKEFVYNHRFACNH